MVKPLKFIRFNKKIFEYLCDNIPKKSDDTSEDIKANSKVKSSSKNKQDYLKNTRISNAFIMLSCLLQQFYLHQCRWKTTINLQANRTLQFTTSDLIKTSLFLNLPESSSQKKVKYALHLLNKIHLIDCKFIRKGVYSISLTSLVVEMFNKQKGNLFIDIPFDLAKSLFFSKYQPKAESNIESLEIENKEKINLSSNDHDLFFYFLFNKLADKVKKTSTQLPNYDIHNQDNSSYVELYNKIKEFFHYDNFYTARSQFERSLKKFMQLNLFNTSVKVIKDKNFRISIFTSVPLTLILVNIFSSVKKAYLMAVALNASCFNKSNDSIGLISDTTV